MTKPGDTAANPVPAASAPLAPKVKWATIGSYVTGVVILGIIAAVTGDSNGLLIDVLPDYLEPFVLPVVPAIVSLGAGFAAKHQWRNDQGNVG